MAVIPVETSGDIRRGASRAIVYVRAAVVDAWALVPELFCDEVVTAAAPDMSAAKFSYRAGVGFTIGGSAYTAHLPLQLDQFQVRVDVYDWENVFQFAWYGIIVNDVRERYGAEFVPGKNQSDPDNRIENSWQTLTAYGMEYLFAITKVLVSRVVAPDGVANELAERGLVFNGGRSNARSNPYDAVGNKHATTLGPDSSAIFDRDVDAGSEQWTTDDIGVYLMANFKPDLGGEQINVRFDTGSAILTWDQPVIKQDGRYLREIMNELWSVQRYVSYVVGWDDVEHELVVRVFTFTDVPFDLGGGNNIPANGRQVSFDFDAAFDIDDVKVSRPSNYLPRQVIVRGARRGCIWTTKPTDDAMSELWAAADKTAYEAGATGELSFGTMTDGEKRKAAAIARAVDGPNQVFRQFGPVDNWDMKAPGSDGGPSLPVCPALDDAGAITANRSPSFVAGWLFEDYVPFLEGIDYSTMPPPASGPENLQRKSVLSFVHVKERPTGEVARWVFGWDLAGMSPEQVAAGQKWSVQVRSRRDALALDINTVGANTAQHVLADNHFTPGDSRLDAAPEMDYADDMFLTVFAIADEHVIFKYPSDAAVPAEHESRRNIVVDRPDRRLDYVSPETIWGFDETGLLLRCELGGFLRDDRQEMEYEAQAAYKWYNRERQKLKFTFRQILVVAEVGYLVTEIGDGATLEVINTPVTKIRTVFGFRGQPNVQQATTVETDFGTVSTVPVGRGAL